MLIDLRKVAPGGLPNEVFDEFVAGNSYGPEMVAALRDHLVHGVEVKIAIKEHGVYANKFKMRLEKLSEDIERVGRINALLSIDQNRLDQVFALASSLASTVDKLRSNSKS
ncbi:hypothetical protein [Pseudomonas sp. MWU12-2323]|uniref:hypothetical protein n=1 Tax=Pseudomonas sp. MWU12-2323 TaxID=2651296 RepID=UPI00128DD637|nr:hypothetical protein [Pseudomonas sp. MWU12-2323]MPQ69487.1 hypothetical protein [Pseudomonas sp. MWU12-2323]